MFQYEVFISLPPGQPEQKLNVRKSHWLCHSKASITQLIMVSVKWKLYQCKAENVYYVIQMTIFLKSVKNDFYWYFFSKRILIHLAFSKYERVGKLFSMAYSHQYRYHSKGNIVFSQNAKFDAIPCIIYALNRLKHKSSLHTIDGSLAPCVGRV